MNTEKTIRKINRSFQITLPPSFRKQFTLKEGDLIELVTENDRLVVRPVEIQRKKVVVKELEKILKQPIEDEIAKMSEEEVMNFADKIIRESRNISLDENCS